MTNTEAETIVIAIDWSGDKKGGAKTTWLAVVADARLAHLANGRTRQQLIGDLIELATTTSRVIVGLDFAFSMPAWFVEERGAVSGSEFWQVVDAEGEAWLDKAPDPFYGKGGKKQPKGVELLRRTEKRSLGAKSTFLINVPGAVGTGSIRGMPFLRELRDNGWRVWPFDHAAYPLVIEIYPRLLTGAVNKGAVDQRRSYLGAYYSNLDPAMAERAASTEDAFDAAISALVMAEHLQQLSSLPDLSHDPIDQIEGRIWNPADPDLQIHQNRSSD